MERVARVRNADVLANFARDNDVRLGKVRTDAKDRASATLAGLAMTSDDTDGFDSGDEFHRATGTVRGMGHGVPSMIVRLAAVA